MNAADIETNQPVTAGPAAEKSPWGAWATIGFSVVIITVFVAIQTLVTMGFLAAQILGNPLFSFTQIVQQLDRNGLTQAIAIIASGTGGLILTLVFVKLRGVVSVSEYLGFKRISWKTVLGIVIITISLIVIVQGANQLINHNTNTSSMADIYNSSGWPGFMWISLVVFAPAFEETFFRSFLFAGLASSRLNVAGTIILTSLVWALMHMQYNISGISTILILGIIMGILRFKTKSLWSPFIMHVTWNFVMLLLIALNIGTT